jgi:predicted HicB family RNase H-like nuclease
MTEKKRGRPATGKTPMHGVRVPDERWQAAKEKAAEEDVSLTDVVNDCLENFIKKGRRKK